MSKRRSAVARDIMDDESRTKPSDDDDASLYDSVASNSNTSQESFASANSTPRAKTTKKAQPARRAPTRSSVRTRTTNKRTKRESFEDTDNDVEPKRTRPKRLSSLNNRLITTATDAPDLEINSIDDDLLKTTEEMPPEESSMGTAEEVETMEVDNPDPTLEEPPIERTETATNNNNATDLPAKISNLTERIQITLQQETTEESDLPLILTGDKRRGVYECDFCRRDVSPFPRIRCATCVDFDLCLDCFASSLSTNKTTAQQQQHPHHKPNHSYRVADSTRFPLFPSAKSVVTNALPASSTTESSGPSTFMIRTDSQSDVATACSQDNSTMEQQEQPTAASTVVTDADLDVKNMWTAEEDLRLLDGIKTFGLGNWTEIAEAIGSNNKNAKRCMERYLDDFLGRYGHILPPQIFIEVEDNSNSNNTDAVAAETMDPKSKTTRKSLTSSKAVKQQKIRVCIDSSQLPGYESVWPNPYVPEGVEIGQEVNREMAFKLEQMAVRAMASSSTKEVIDRIRAEYPEKDLVIPPRLEDIQALDGSELAGYMPRRGDFDVEWDNDAENILAEMEFSPSDPPNERALKLQVLGIYNEKLDERERRKQFLKERNLLCYQKNYLKEKLLPPEEKDLINRMRLFARFHSLEEHESLIADLLRAKQLRREIAKLQLYRKMGIRKLVDADRYELDKNRREQLQSAVKKTKEQELFNSEILAPRTFEELNVSSSAIERLQGNKEQIEKADGVDSSKVIDAARQIEENAIISTVCETNTAEPVITESSDEMMNNKVVSIAAPQYAESQKNDSERNDIFEIANMTGFDLLSSKEIMLCKKLRLAPMRYIAVKNVLLRESLNAGMLSSDGEARKTVFQLDIEQREGVFNFVLKAGWLNAKSMFFY